LQKDIFNAELYFRLLPIANFGDLNRMTQFKSATVKNAQLLTYPILMTHDVAGYEEIVVGEDQHQHLQFARKLLKKYNGLYSEKFLIPKANIVVGRVKDLRDPDKKMSKSMPDGCLFLTDTPDIIRAKLRKASVTPEGLENLRFLCKEFGGDDTVSFNEGLKNEVAESIIRMLKKF
jgi:tryptophanyl-tRNA synthetase